MTLAAYFLGADLRRRWRSLVLLAVLVAAVVAVILGALSGAGRTERAFDDYLARVGAPAGIAVADDPYDVVPAEDITAVDGVATTIGFRWYAAFPGDLQTQFFPMIVPDDSRVPDDYLHSPVVEGRRPDPSEPDEVALSERSARRLSVGVGDSLTVTTFTQEQLDGDFGFEDGGSMALDVVGILRGPGDIASRETDLELTLLTPAFGERYGDTLGLFSSGVLVVADEGVSQAEMAARVRDETSVVVEGFMAAETLRRQANPTLLSMANGLRILAGVIALVGGTAVVLTVAREVVGRMSDHAVLSAMGLTRRGLLAYVGLAPAVAVTAGTLVGGTLSAALAPASQWGIARRAQVGSAASVDLGVIVVGTMVALVVLLATILAVATIALRRERRPGREWGRPSSVAARAAGLGAPLSIVTGLRLAFDRGRGARTTPIAAAAAAAALGGLGVVASMVFSSSLDHAVATPAMWGWDMDAILSRDVDGTGAGPQRENDPVIPVIAEDESFSEVAEYVIDFDLVIEGKPDAATVLGDIKGHTPFVLARGREPLAADEVLAGGTMLEDYDTAVGDTITLTRGDQALEVEIVGVAVMPVNDDGGLSSTGLGLRLDTAEQLGFSGVCEDSEPCSRGLAITAAPGVDPREAAEPYVADGFVYVTPTAPSEVARLSAVDGLPRVVAGFLGIISILTLAHAAAVTVRRRRRDLAMLRALGFVGRDLRNAVRVQVVALSLCGALVGVVLGLAIGRQIWAGVAFSVFLPPVVTVPLVALGVVPIAIVILSQVGATISRRAAGRIPAGVVLRTE